MALVALLLAVGAFAADAPKMLPADKSCSASECHQDLTAFEFNHGPVNMNQCEPCHIPINGEHRFEAAGEGRDLCLVCHDAEAAMPVQHAPFETDCAVCHDPHGSDNRYFVRGGAGAEGCMRCHTDVREGLSHLHGPVALGECLACHTPHQSEYEGLLVEQRTALCTGCHVDMEQRIEGAVSVHPPVEEQCAGCHLPHGGDREYFLVDEGRALCNECHGDFLKETETFKFTHQAMVEGEACQNCHDSHASNQERLLAAKSEDLCLNCHNEPIDGPHGMIDNIAEQVENFEYLHGPVRQGNCSACHDAHGSDNSFILDKAFPEDFYDSYSEDKYQLCFDCHDQRLVLDEMSEETGFRNGKVNLHYLHVNREKGRTCRACHHEHGSNQPKHIRSVVPFGRWEMQLEYTMTDTGGGCATGCHVPYSYDREDAVDNAESSAP